MEGFLLCWYLPAFIVALLVMRYGEKGSKLSVIDVSVVALFSMLGWMLIIGIGIIHIMKIVDIRNGKTKE